MDHRYLRFPGGKGKALTFSYDDGVVDDIRLIEIFRQHRMRATFNLNSNRMQRTNHIDLQKAPLIYTDDVCEVACHGANHMNLVACDSVTAITDVLNDRLQLEKIFGKQIHGMAYAYGTHNDDVVTIVKNAGIHYSRTAVSTLKFNLTTDWLRLPATCHHKNPALMELADRFLNLKIDDDPKVFFVWGHSYEFSSNNNWSIIEDFCDKMADNNEIWYCTNMELYTAWSDYQRLERSADCTQLYNPSARSVWVGDENGNTWEIKPGESLTCE